MKDDEAPPPEEDKIFREMVAKSLEKQGDEKVTEVLAFELESFAGKFVGLFDPERTLERVKVQLDSYPELTPEQVQDFQARAAGFIRARLADSIREALDLLEAEVTRQVEVAVKGRTPSTMVKAVTTARDFSLRRRLLAPPQGRPGTFNDNDVRAAFNALGADATQDAVAKSLGVSIKRMKQYRTKKGFKHWEDLRRHFTEGA